MRNKALIDCFRKPARRLRECRNGLAATEFALLLPVMVVMFFGLIEASNAMTVNRRVAISANMLADLAAQSEQLFENEITDLFEGVIDVLEETDGSTIQMSLVSVVLDGDGNPVVHWSRDRTGAAPYAAGADYTKLDNNDVVSASASLIIVEMIYAYDTDLTSYIIRSPIEFRQQSIRWPRVTNRVQLCDAQNNCTT